LAMCPPLEGIGTSVVLRNLSIAWAYVAHRRLGGRTEAMQVPPVKTRTINTVRCDPPEAYTIQAAQGTSTTPSTITPPTRHSPPKLRRNTATTTTTTTTTRTTATSRTTTTTKTTADQWWLDFLLVLILCFMWSSSGVAPLRGFSDDSSPSERACSLM